PRRLAVELAEGPQLLRGPPHLALQEQGQHLPGADAGHVPLRVGEAQGARTGGDPRGRLRGGEGEESPPAARRGEVAALEGQLPEQVEGLLSGAAAERLVHDPAEELDVAELGPLPEPAFGGALDAAAVVGKAGGGEGGDAGVAQAAELHA